MLDSKWLFIALAVLSCTYLPADSRVGACAIECASDKVPLYIQRTYKTDAFRETFEISEGDTVTGTRVYKQNGISLDNSVRSYEVCLSKTLHTLVLKDS